MLLLLVIVVLVFVPNSAYGAETRKCIPISATFDKDTIIMPMGIMEAVDKMTLSGTVTVLHPNFSVRVVMRTTEGKEHLMFELYDALCDASSRTFTDYSEWETELLKHETPSCIKIYLRNVKLSLDAFYKYVNVDNPFVVDGKTWQCARLQPLSEEVEYTVKYTIQGDTLINGDVWKKLLCNGQYESALYEYGKTVYEMNAGQTIPHKLYQFGLSAGDTCLTQSAGWANPSVLSYIKILSTDSVKQAGYSYYTCDVKEYTGGEETGRDTWVEGVGSFTYPTANIAYPGNSYALISCTWPDGRQYVTEYGKKYLEEQDKDYEPFLVEGKEWLCEWEHGITGDKRIERYMLQGDTVIDGVVWKKMYENGVCYRVWREENKKRYALRINDSGSVPELMYDFNLSVDDTLLTINHTDTDNYACYRVKSQDTIVQNDCTYHLQTIYFYLVQDGEKNELSEVLWIEGVGSEFCPTMNLPYVGNPTTLISCTWPDGRQYVTEYGKKYLKGIRSIKNEEKNNAIYDLQGRKVAHPKQGEIYIQNGKKYINK
jgi:hypothetical protein